MVSDVHSRPCALGACGNGTVPDAAVGSGSGEFTTSAAEVSTDAKGNNKIMCKPYFVNTTPTCTWKCTTTCICRLGVVSRELKLGSAACDKVIA